MYELLQKTIELLLRMLKNLRKLPKMKAGGLTVGSNFSMQDGVSIDPSHYWHIKIGDNVTLARNVQILAHDASTKSHLGYTRIGKVSIGNTVFVGAGSIILPGVSIGDNSIIGAGSLVTTDVPPNTIVAGNPARFLCTIDEFLTKHKRQMEMLPCFGEEYTLQENVSLSMRKGMNRQMTQRIGYIV